MTIELIKKIIEEEVENALSYEKPSEVETVEDAFSGGDNIEDPTEHIPEDVPADSDKPQAKVQSIKDVKVENVVRITESQLRELVEQCMCAHEDMNDDKDDDQLPSWVQSKITKASDYLQSVFSYLDYEDLDED